MGPVITAEQQAAPAVRGGEDWGGAGPPSNVLGGMRETQGSPAVR